MSAIDPKRRSVPKANRSYHHHLAPEFGRKDRLRDEGMDAAHNVEDLSHSKTHGSAAKSVDVQFTVVCFGANEPSRRGLSVCRALTQCAKRSAAFNALRARRLMVLVHCQDGSVGFSPVACGDPNCRAQTESARLGAKE